MNIKINLLIHRKEENVIKKKMLYCSNCNKYINTDKGIVYIDVDNNIFCSVDCFNNHYKDKISNKNLSCKSKNYITKIKKRIKNTYEAKNRLEESKNQNLRETLIVNLFGVPGAGKSTGASYIFYKLKSQGLNVELITEFAKDKVWEQNVEALKNQTYVFGEQSFKLSRCFGKVDAIITDSPLPLSILYNQDPRLTENFNKSVMDVFNSYRNINYLIERTKPYNPIGRLQTEKESDALMSSILNLFKERGISYQSVKGNAEGYDIIVKNVLEAIK